MVHVNGEMRSVQNQPQPPPVLAPSQAQRDQEQDHRDKNSSFSPHSYQYVYIYRDLICTQGLSASAWCHPILLFHLNYH